VRSVYPRAKRLMDVAISATALLLASPLTLAGALATRATSPGPAFYRAKRAGLHGEPFAMYKLRTMRVGADPPDRRVTTANDDRVTAVGRILRKFKIDELPQFWNVLRGDMSIVGPRPEDWEIVQRHYAPEQRRILSVRPGIASPVDVHWYPDLMHHDPPPPGVDPQEWYVRRHLPVQVAEGLSYVERQSLGLDLKVIADTIACVLIRSWLPKRRAFRPAPAADEARSSDSWPVATSAGTATDLATADYGG
jgi:lipopolysaccharide/colanic/teichoic acid biosynthesis glycosyltransferase